MPTSIVWFRQDLRLTDNPALQAALQRGGQIIALYIDSSGEEGDWAPGAAARWWLHRSLQSLASDLQSRGASLCFARGHAGAVLGALCSASGADAVFWNRRYEPLVTQRDARLKQVLRDKGLLAESRNGSLLIEPWEISNQGGKPFQVFTPFWRQVLKQIDPVAPLPAATRIASAQPLGEALWPGCCTLDELELMPDIHWYGAMEQLWQPGEAGAAQLLDEFANAHLSAYRDARDQPAVAGTSRLSPYLHVGAISPRQIWQVIGAVEARRGLGAEEWRGGKFLAELIWREFAHHLLYHFPQIPDEPLRTEFKHFAWRDDSEALRAWQQGRTGIPLVDAGMRELWATGWMHNRVRMVVASFLVKNLRLRWQLGARWFWDTLIDADLANNTQGWQWSAGCGADAAPYFRIFNPVTQAQKFDPGGEYLHRWLPELAEPGGSYPQPIVDLQESRANALAAFRQLRHNEP